MMEELYCIVLSLVIALPVAWMILKNKKVKAWMER